MPPVTKVSDNNELLETSKFPHAKWSFEKFNPVQSRVFEYYDKDNNLIIATATSSGKTVVGEMLLSHEIRKRGGKGMYLVPLRALAQEKIDEWTDKDHHFHDLKISVCTGDYRLTAERKKELDEADLIIMSYEMFNSRVRNLGSERSDFLKKIGTIVADEVHLLTVPKRGDHLEAGLMRFTEINKDCRMVFLSATMPNVDEIANWVSFILNSKDTVLVSSDSAYSINSGVELTIVAYPDNGMRLARWRISGETAADNPHIWTINANATVNVVFEPVFEPPSPLTMFLIRIVEMTGVVVAVLGVIKRRHAKP
jgi:replicative superfamily II helicase